jgi:hypothetical protein
MTSEELEEHVNILRTSRHTFLPHLAHILRKLMEHSDNRGLFNEPVKIPGYTDIIKNPIDLHIIRSRLVSGEYTSIENFSNDVHLVFDNAIKYNRPEDSVHKSALKMKVLFENLKKKAFLRMKEEDENPLLRVLNLRTESSAATRNDKANKNKNKSKKRTGKRNNQYTIRRNNNNNNNNKTTNKSNAMDVEIDDLNANYNNINTNRNNSSSSSTNITSTTATSTTTTNTTTTNTTTTNTTTNSGNGGSSSSNNYMSYRKTNGTDPKNNVNFKARAGLKCSLCHSGDLVLSIPVLRCGAPCNAKIARGANYYIAPTASPEGLSQHWCQRCFNNLPFEFSALYGQRMKKKDLIPCKNDEVFLEKWIKCGTSRRVTGPAHLRRCSNIMHMACALYIPTTRVPLRPPYQGLGWSTTNSNGEVPAVDTDPHFKCPECLLRDSDTQWDKHCIPASTPRNTSLKGSSTSHGGKDVKVNEWHAGYSATHNYTASALPESSLSRRIERRIRRRIHSEAILEGGTYSREEASDFLSIITVRALAGEYRELARWPRLARWIEAQKSLYGSMQLNNFSYRPIAVFLFQRISGTDVCLFAMYVHEYGVPGEKSPNGRKAYVSYLDSTNYMQPSVFRTPTYHEIMLGYVEDAKVRGFDSIYIWACPPPPRAGDSYILNCHPKWQRTPNTERLVKWYKTIEAKAKDDGLVVQTEDFLSGHFFGHRAHRQTRGSIHSSRRRAASGGKLSNIDHEVGRVHSVPAWGKGGRPSNLGEIPHFSGDFWLAEAESILQELEGFSEIEDDPDEGMRKWWQELTRRDLDRGTPSKKRKASALEEVTEANMKPWSKFDRQLTATIPKDVLKHVKDIKSGKSSISSSSSSSSSNNNNKSTGSSSSSKKKNDATMYKTVKVKANIMENSIKWILQRRVNDRRAWQEQLRKLRNVKPKAKVVIPDIKTRESWVMAHIAARIGPMKEHHLVWHLHHKCFGCLKHITSNEVKYLYEPSPPLSKTNEHFLCEKCHKKKDQKSLFAFRYDKYRKRKTIQLKIKELQPDNELLRKSPTINSYGTHIPTVTRSSIFDTRMALLAYLQRMSFQFDQLRRAKHSSMMILYHLHCAMTRNEEDLPPQPPGLSLSDQVYQ